MAEEIFGHAELALQETKSAETLAVELEKEGFKVERGVSGMPTAFVARIGSGSPVVGILAEYDALPGLSQKSGTASKQPVVEGAPGHGCGHNLLGTAAVAAAALANRERIARKLPGTLVVFGTPAEEQIIGKTFLARDGAFVGTDVLLSWHPEDLNYVYTRPRLAITVVDVEFFGTTAHAAASPWMGRNALSALELFDHAIALMRESVLPTARMHRVIKAGGVAANVIPDYTKVQYFVRDETGERVDGMLRRLRKAADGAALATETRAQVTVLAATREPIYNEVLSRVMQQELEKAGAPAFDARDQELARAIQKEIGVETSGLALTVIPYGPLHGGTASSDVGEASAVVPLAELAVATRPQGTPAHHWAQTSCAGTDVGRKGMHVAARVLARSLEALLASPAKVAEARAEWTKATKGRPYVSPLAEGAKPARW
ncbi:MAG: amidohydrolase [Acidobacteria bacterium]|nr:amidohydrolase [Acidobacteriota bacterium]